MSIEFVYYQINTYCQPLVTMPRMYTSISYDQY